MNRTFMAPLVGAVMASLCLLEAAPAATYTRVMLPPGATPAVGPGVILPKDTFGKEYSRNLDEDFMGVLDPEQVVAWDGIGGTADGLDYSLSRGPNFPREQEVDATANSRDALFDALREDVAHLVFSHDDVVAVPSPLGGLAFAPAVPLVGLVPLSNGNVIFGAAEISVEEAGTFTGPPEVQYGWATAPEIQGMAPPKDLDGLEVWGPEPAFTEDADKYSLEDDVMAGLGTSVFSYDLGTGTSVSYIAHATIVSAVEALLGPIPTFAFNRHDKLWRDAINLDALMVQDRDGVLNEFGPGDSIIFSINQIVDPSDPFGLYATGSELFVLDATAAGIAPGFLFHGTHPWDKGYALGALRIVGGPGQGGIIDINAIEAIGELVVPEPCTVLLLGIAAFFGIGRRRES